MRKPSRRHRCIAAAAVATAMLPALVAAAPGVANATSSAQDERSWPYWRTDLHAHSSVSGDATTDLGIISTYAKTAGFNAVFVTDHQAASYNPIGGVVSSHVPFDDDSGPNRQWDDVPSAPTATASAGPSTEQFLSGTRSYKASVSNTGEAFGWIKRGPNLHSGQVTLKVSVYPTRIDPGAGLYVSMSIGGDPTIPNREQDGYTTQNGTVLAGHSTTFVWQLGTPRVASDDGVTRVITNNLAYQLNKWNSYTIDVTAAVNAAFPDPATAPDPLNGLLFLKMAAGSRTGGSATGYFDSYSLDAANAPTTSSGAAQAAANDFVARNQHISDWDTPTFKLFPARELGFNDHSQQLVYPISDPATWVQYSKGTAGIPAVQADGYPAQLNHPGLPGGVTDQEAFDTDAYGAELMEAVERGTNDVMIRDWDTILTQYAKPLIGTWTSDSHRNATYGPTTFIQAPALTRDDLLHSLFEGRTFLAPVGFGGSVSFTPDGTTTGSYPARYPVFLSSQEDLGTLDLNIGSGLQPGQSVVWVSNGAAVATDAVTGASFTAHRAVPLGTTANTYVRAEVRDGDGSRAAMTEPIFFDRVAGLPRGFAIHAERVTTPTDRGYTNANVKGITGVTASGATLTASLDNPSGSLVEVRANTGSRGVSAVRANGTALSPSTSLAAFLAATSGTWYFDSVQRRLYVKAVQGSGVTSLAIDTVAGSDTTAPTTPGSFAAIADNARSVSLSWTASTDDSGVTSYVVRRDGVVVASLPSNATSFHDGSVSPDTTYTYTVTAVDGSSNTSTPASATVHTQPVTTTVVAPDADTYVSAAAPTTNYGAAKTLKVDADPISNGYLRFSPPAVSGQLLSARLQLTSTASQSKGWTVSSVADTSWGERTITYNSAPAMGAVVASSGAVTGGVPASADVTSIVRPGSPVSIGVTTSSTTNTSIYTRENGTNIPQLVLESSTVAPHGDPVSVSTPQNTTVSFRLSVSGGNGNALSCALGRQPASGSAFIASNCSSGQYTPRQGFSGSDSFTYTVSDGTQTTSATVSVNVTGTNQPPAGDPEATGAVTDEDTPVTVTLTANDPNGDCPLSFTVTAAPAHGQLGPLGTPTCTSGSASVSARYTPNPDYNGSDNITYTASDGKATSAPIGFTITIAAVNDPPVARGVSVAATSGQSTPWTPQVSDVDSPSLSCTIATAPAHGSASVASDCSTGSYTSTNGYAGSDSFTYRVSDGSAAATGTVSVTVSSSTTTPPPAFSDGFESGDFSAWTKTANTTVCTPAHTGSWAGCVDTSGGSIPSYAKKTLGSGLTDITETAWLRPTAGPASGSAGLMRLRTAGDAAVVSLLVDPSLRLRVRNEVTKVTTTSTAALPASSWSQVSLHVVIAGANSSVDVLVNGTSVLRLSNVDLGSTPLQVVQVGENATGNTLATGVDDVRVTGT